MADSQSFFGLPKKDQHEALLMAASSLGRPVHLLEKDIWVVWALGALFEGPFEKHLVFKGGTSLSKVHCAINRFSEDVDVTYDIRQLIPDVVGETSSGLPRSNAQANKWTKAVRERLPVWVLEAVQPLIQRRIERDQVSASVRSDDDKLHIDYEPSHEGTGYIQATALLEFGARSTGEPADVQDVHCDIAPTLGDLMFPTARPRVMRPERTFWEKATAAHVYCHQGTFRGGHRYARHWYDLLCLNTCGIAKEAIRDREVANRVAAHKQLFFWEKASSGGVIDYKTAVAGRLRLVTEDKALSALEEDYRKMNEDGLFSAEPPGFADLFRNSRTLSCKQTRRTAMNCEKEQVSE